MELIPFALLVVKSERLAWRFRALNSGEQEERHRGNHDEGAFRSEMLVLVSIMHELRNFVDTAFEVSPGSHTVKPKGLYQASDKSEHFITGLDDFYGLPESQMELGGRFIGTYRLLLDSLPTFDHSPGRHCQFLLQRTI